MLKVCIEYELLTTFNYKTAEDSTIELAGFDISGGILFPLRLPFLHNCGLPLLRFFAKWSITSSVWFLLKQISNLVRNSKTRVLFSIQKDLILSNVVRLNFDFSMAFLWPKLRVGFHGLCYQ